MKVLFIFYNFGSGVAFHSGILMLGALAKREGHETKLLHFHDELVPDDPDFYIPMAKEFRRD